LIGEEDEKVFETVTIDFLNENLPTEYIVTKVEVQDQKLARISVRQTLRMQQPPQTLVVDLYVEGSGAPSAEIFDDEITSSFEKQQATFKNKLADASSIFRRMFYPSPITTPIAVNDEGSYFGKVFIAVGSIFGALSILGIGTLLVISRKRREATMDPQLEVLSWSTNSVTNRSYEQKTADVEDIFLMDPPTKLDPSGVEIYQDLLTDAELRSDMQLSPIAESTSMKSPESVKNQCFQLCRTSRIEKMKKQRNEDDKDDGASDRSSALEIERTFALYANSQTTGDESTPIPIHKGVSSDETGQNRKSRNRYAKRNESTNESYTTNTGGILDYWGFPENEWEGQLDNKVDSVSETPQQKKSEKFKKSTRT